MVDVVIFIFSDFWRWLGALLMISAFGASLGQGMRPTKIVIRNSDDD